MGYAIYLPRFYGGGFLKKHYKLKIMLSVNAKVLEAIKAAVNGGKGSTKKVIKTTK